MFDMKKMNWTFIITIALLLFSCKSTLVSTDRPNLATLKDGVYEGNATGLDKATVRIVLENHHIMAVKLIRFEATHFGQKAKDSIPARIFRLQTPLVDAVTGATEGSNIIINATIDAMKKAESISN